MSNYNEVTRSAITLAYRMGLFSFESPLWGTIDYGHPSFIRWADWWDSGELREALDVLREALDVLREVDNDRGEDRGEDSGEISRVVEELAALDAEGADIYGGEWCNGDIVMYTEQGVEEYIQEYCYDVHRDLANHLLYYVDYKAMARDSILSGDWQRVSSISQTYYVAN